MSEITLRDIVYIFDVAWFLVLYFERSTSTREYVRPLNQYGICLSCNNCACCSNTVALARSWAFMLLGLEEQLLAHVVNKEKPELEEQRSALVRAINEYMVGGGVLQAVSAGILSRLCVCAL